MRDGRRALATTDAGVRSLHETLEREVGQAFEPILYDTGLEWSRLDALEFRRHVLEVCEVDDVHDVSGDVLFALWWWGWRTAGWGACTWDASGRHRGVLVLRLHGSPIPRALVPSGRCQCHLLAGLFGGMLSFIERRERRCLETRCLGRGDDLCVFLVASPPAIEQATRWSRDGEAFESIRRRLTS